MQFKIDGAERETGEERSFTVQAVSAGEARQKANAAGYLVSAVVPLGDGDSPAATSPQKSKSTSDAGSVRPTPSHRRNSPPAHTPDGARAVATMIVAGGFVVFAVFVVIVCAGGFKDSPGKNPPRSAYDEEQDRRDSAAYRQAKRLAPDASFDEQWKLGQDIKKLDDALKKNEKR